MIWFVGAISKFSNLIDGKVGTAVPGCPSGRRPDLAVKSCKPCRAALDGQPGTAVPTRVMRIYPPGARHESWKSCSPRLPVVFKAAVELAAAQGDDGVGSAYCPKHA